MRRMLCVLMLMLPGMSWATMYKCLEDGEVVYSTTPCGDNAQMMLNNKDQVSSQGRLALHMNINNVYSYPGTVNGFPVTMGVDPSASNTVISQRVAESAGIHRCSGKGNAPAGNWVVGKCMVTVHEITLGDFSFKDATVLVSPNMNTDGSLGKDVLGRMRVQQGDGVLYLSNR